MNPLIEQLSKYGPISAAAIEALNAKTRYFEKKKHSFFLKEGQQSSSYFVLNKGLVRAYFVKNNKEVNAWFGEEGQIFYSIVPAYTSAPSCENLQFLEDSEIYALATSDLNELYQLYPELNLIGRKIAEEVCQVMEERITSLHTESAIERYQSLIKLQPQLLQRINLGYIASYLGITQETLSRIRKA